MSKSHSLRYPFLAVAMSTLTMTTWTASTWAASPPAANGHRTNDAGINVRANDSQPAARVHAFAKADGTNYFAIGLSLPKDVAVDIAAANSKTAHDVVVLFDTSASQAGPFRDRALVALDTMLSKFDKNDRVHLMAVDLAGNAMTRSFVAPTSDEMKAAVEKLNRRTPLGSTDMVAALRAALDSFSGNSNASGNPRSVVYIGDGVSAANLSGSKELRQAVDDLAKNRVAVTGYAIGPERNAMLLAAIANQTGGMVALDGSAFGGEQAGAYLAAAARGAVVWPTSVVWPSSLVVLPKKMIPLRLDRDTIVVGTGKPTDAMRVEMSAVAGRGVKLQWNLSAAKSLEDNAYLASVVEGARADGGVGLTTLGSGGLDLARRMSNRGAEFLSEAARRAVGSGDLRGARPLIEELRQVDPHHPDLAVLDSIYRQKSRAVTTTTGKSKKPADNATRSEARSDARGAVRATSPFRLAAYQKGGGAAADDDRLPTTRRPDKDALDEAELRKRGERERIEKEVEAAINEARKLMNANPRLAIDDLKLKREYVELAPELDAETRGQLLDKIGAAVRAAENRVTVVDDKTAREAEKEARARERVRVEEGITLKQEKVRQWMAQFRTLMDEARYADPTAEPDPGRDPLRTIVPLIEREAPDSGLAASVKGTASIAAAHATSAAIQARHAQGALASLVDVDVSSTPFSDRIPITYPDPDTWRKLTISRKQYSSVDLQQRGGAEKKIYQALDDITSLEFIDAPLDDPTGDKGLVQQIFQKHKIQVVVEKKKIEEGGSGEITLNRTVNGISLRSALRIILKEHDLAYVVENEVLTITTAEDAKTRLTTKVYPVADLVLPIKPYDFLGGFGSFGNAGGNPLAGNSGGGDAGGGGGGGGFGNAGGGAGF